MKITIETTIQASIDKVWECWTSPTHVINWNFASPDWCCPRATNDLRAGGKFIYRMESVDGKMGFDFEGTYVEIIDNEKISYHLEDGRLVEITFSVDGNNVLLTESFEAEGTNSDEQQRAGWQAILENFKNYVESQN